MNQEYLDEMNRVRAEHNIAPLKWSDELEGIAQKHAEVVARSRRNRLWHPGSGNEIAALGQDSIVEACESWLKSDGHRAIMLGLYYSEVGIASKMNRHGNMVWMAQFQ